MFGYIICKGREVFSTVIISYLLDGVVEQEASDNPEIQPDIPENQADNPDETHEGFVLLHFPAEDEMGYVVVQDGERSGKVRDTKDILEDGDFENLMVRAATHHYESLSRNEIDEDVGQICSFLIEKDYDVKVLKNPAGSFCYNYPSWMVVPNKSKTDENSKPCINDSDWEGYENLAKLGNSARCRNRFPIPVILWKNKFICRSGTVTNRKSAAVAEICKGSEESTWFSSFKDTLEKCGNAVMVVFTGVSEKKEIDASILGVLNIRCIADLMVEERKVHTGMFVSSSEKVNQDFYKDFKLLRIPYPGCEFFREYSKIKTDLNYDQLKKDLIFSWEISGGESTLGSTEYKKEMKLPEWDIDWNSYKEWNLIKMTKIYLRLLIHHLKEGDGGMLVHCISGWDRTPLFISLLRVILWAENEIHQSLESKEMAYLIMGYDWYLFGHDLPNRLQKSEEMLHFFINFLPELQSPEDFIEMSESAKIKIEEVREILWENYKFVEREIETRQ